MPTHKVRGAITVQTLLGNARLIVDSSSYDLPTGTIVSVGAGVPHEVFADSKSVLLVTHAL